LMFVVPSLPPGIETTINTNYFMSPIFSKAFGISEKSAIWMIMPAQLGMALGFIIPYGRLLQSLADSNLAPSMFQLGGQKTITRGMIVGSVLSFIFCLLAFFIPVINAQLQNICLLAATFTYFAQITGFIMLRRSHGNLPRNFVSPFGVPGAIFSALVFVLLNLSVIFFQDDDYVTAIVVLILIVVFTLYYYLFAETKQTISMEETKFDVLNANRKALSELRKGRGNLLVRGVQGLVNQAKRASGIRVRPTSPPLGSFSRTGHNDDDDDEEELVVDLAAVPMGVSTKGKVPKIHPTNEPTGASNDVEAIHAKDLSEEKFVFNSSTAESSGLGTAIFEMTGPASSAAKKSSRQDHEPLIMDDML